MSIKTKTTISLKKKLVEHYIYLKLFLLGTFGLTFLLLDNIPFACYPFILFFLTGFAWIIARNSHEIKYIIHAYFIIAPAFRFFIMLDLWNYSTMSSTWLLPIPLAAYILLEKKYIFIYSAYLVLLIILACIISQWVSFGMLKYKNKSQIAISDSFTIISNILIFNLLLYYKNQIRSLEITNRLQLKKNKAKPENNNQDLEKHQHLFLKIRDLIEGEELFKDSRFSVAKLVILSDISIASISKALKIHGYGNFHHYLNTCRINYIKKLMSETDLTKTSLMSMYINAGFSNQPTFNRVFKQIEGITPSEYINTLLGAGSYIENKHL
ncbi:helix-turn-helix domain-containing protein [Chryseobacterium sp. RG1]|uniref:Helix-turn-helix domain-containing protein n=1 Tax=Chryseobacterium tagetis TaxID=2801334 RepID=A0ABS7ZZL8_9FLAO|nr:helix-turn-helix domain-containing protein [Chryseobacterium tagetis]MCA6065911.1 helix-turn-helix domain-containing protein [Chryseobacterium tagetis]